MIVEDGAGHERMPWLTRRPSKPIRFSAMLAVSVRTSMSPHSGRFAESQLVQLVQLAAQRTVSF